MRDDRIKAILRATLHDGELTRAERDELRAIDAAKRAVVQSFAFDLANEAIEAKTLPHFTALNWLEKVIKALAPAPLPVIAAADTCEALFAPEHNCCGRIVELFTSARASADVCVFTITDDRISDAMLRAHRRGLRIRIITDNDKSFDPGSDIDRFRAAGIPVRIDRSIDHMHHKFAIFDGAILLSGSYNWTRSASDCNEENLLLTTEKRLVAPFRELFERLWESYR